MRQRRFLLPLACLLVPTAGGLLWRASHFLPSYKEQEAARLSLPELEKGLAAHQNEAGYLYQLGAKLHAAGRSEEALGVLERAAGLNPDDARIRRAWTDVLMATGRVTGAFSYLQQFSRSHPNSSEGHTLLGEFYGSQNSMERAKEELETATRLDPKNSHAWTLLAKVREYYSNVGGARDAVLTALKTDPQNADAHAFLGHLQTNGEPEAAVRSLREAVRLAPEESAYARSLAAVLLDLAKPEPLTEAETLLRGVLKRSEKDGEALLLLGRALLQSDKAVEAIPLLEKADTLVPGEVLGAKLLRDAYRRLGNTAQTSHWEAIYAERQRDAEAYRKLRDQLIKDPKNPETHRQVAHLMAKRGQPEQTLRHYASATGAALDSPKALVLAANDLSAFGFGKEALPLARLAVRHGQNNPGAIEARGNALLAIGRIREASVDYQRVSDLQREKIPLYRQKLLAAAQRHAQNPTPGERLLQQAQQLRQSQVGPVRTTNDILALVEKAVALEPENTVLLSQRFEMLIARRERDKALAAGRALLQLSPEDTQTHARMAALLADTDEGVFDPAEVEQHLEEAQDDPLVQPTIRYVQGLLALRRQDWPSAVTELRAAIAMDPSSDLAYLRLAKAERAAGNEKEATAVTQTYERRRREKQEEADLLMAIADRPDQKDTYQKAIQYYRQKGKTSQAEAIRQEARHRFGNF